MSESPAHDSGSSVDEHSLSTLLTDIARSNSIEQALDTMLNGLDSLTGASLLHFECLHDDEYRLARTRGSVEVREPDQTLHDAGGELAGHLPTLLEAGRAGFDTYGAMLVSRIGGGDHTTLPIRESGIFDRVFRVDVAAIAPLRFASETTGVLIALWPAPTPIATSASEAGVVARVALLTSPVLHRMLRIKHLQDRVAEVETIRRLTDSIARTPSLSGSLDIVCRSARLITGLDLVASAMTSGDYLAWNAASGAIDPSFLGSRIAMPSHFIRGIMQRGQEVILSDVRAHPELEPKIIPVHTRERLRSSVTIPVYVNARLRAILLFGSRRVRPYHPSEVRTMHAIAGAVATAIAADDAHVSRGDNT